MLEKKRERVELVELKEGDIFWSDRYNCLLKFIFYADFMGYYCRKLYNMEGVLLKNKSNIYKCPSLIEVLL